jgi:hypothetical protein
MSGFSMAVDVTANDASPQFAPGQRYSTPDGKEYAYYLFYNGAGSVAAVVGNFAYVYAASGASAGATTTVTSDLSDSANVGAGVFQAVLTDGYYGWFQVGGFATLTTALTAGADGNALTPVGATDGTLDVSAAVTDHVCAIAIDASAKIVKLVNM